MEALKSEVTELQKQRDAIIQRKEVVGSEVETLKVQVAEEQKGNDDPCLSHPKLGALVLITSTPPHFLTSSEFAARQGDIRRRAFDAEKGPEFFEKRLGLNISKRKSKPVLFSESWFL